MALSKTNISSGHLNDSSRPYKYIFKTCYALEVQQQITANRTHFSSTKLLLFDTFYSGNTQIAFDKRNFTIHKTCHALEVEQQITANSNP